MFTSQQILENRYKIHKQLALHKQLELTSRCRQTWLAEDLTDMDWVIIKFLAFDPQMRWEDLKLFEREATILQQLKHPRIPSYRDYFEIDSNIGGGVTWFALVQEYIPGFSLQELLEQPRLFTEDEILDFANQILQILQYLHSLLPPVLHRDIKPSNIIKSPDGHIYLIDFGSVQAQYHNTGITFTVVGSSGYTPLEQFWGKAIPASDIYALGATMLHLLTGISPANLPHKNSRILLPENINISSNLRDWLYKAISPDIEQRFSTASLALQALFQTPVDYTIAHRDPRPAYTRIKLTQTTDKLTIVLPPGGYRKLAKILDPDFWSMERKLTARFFGELNDISPLSMAIVAITIVLIALMIGLPLLFFILILVKILIVYSETIDIYLDSHQLELIRQSLGFVYGCKRINLSEIIEIKIKKNPFLQEVVIETEESKILIGHALREDECQWLIASISNWINKSTFFVPFS